MGGTPGAPPLGHCPRDVINLKNAPTLGHSQAPPLGHCPCDVIHIFQGWNKIAKGWNKIAKGWNKIAKGWNKIAERWNKIAKGWNKIFGMGNWGGVVRPPPPTPPGYGPEYTSHYCTVLAIPRPTRTQTNRRGFPGWSLPLAPVLASARVLYRIF